MVLSCAELYAAAQEELMRAAMYIHGLGSEEEVETWMLEQLEGMRPVSVNAPGKKAGLILSDYQLATLEDYRSHSGDILSFEELALVDGFGKEAVDALKPFLSLWSPRVAGSIDTVKTHGDWLLRATEKNIGTKVKVTGRAFQIAAAARTDSWKSLKGAFRTAHAEVNCRNWTLTLGDYNVRYGQGLAHWSGFTMSSLSTPDAFIRRPAGISPQWSFSQPSHRGAAVEYGSRGLSAAVFADIDGFIGTHVGKLWRYGQVGMSLMSGGSGKPTVSMDGRLNYKGVDFAGEAAAAGGTGAIQGAAGMKAGGLRLVFQGRAIPSGFSGKKNGEFGLAAGASWKSEKWRQLTGKSGFGSSVPAHSAYITADMAFLPIRAIDTDRRQIRIYADWKWQTSGTISLQTHFTGRYRNYEPGRSDLRTDVHFASGPWLANGRLEGVYCETPGFLGYLEGGYKDDTLVGYVRLGAFSTGGWSSRIYCYERDAPGSFNVPAYYGNGISASLYGYWKVLFGPSHQGKTSPAARLQGKTPRTASLRGKVCLRAACTWKPSSPPAPSLRLQLQLAL